LSSLPKWWRRRESNLGQDRVNCLICRGLRITVGDVLECLANGMSEDEILRDFPDLEREDIRAVLAFAAERERKVRRPSAG